MSLLQEMLDKIEARAAHESMKVSRDIAIIERGYEIAGRLKEAGLDPLVTIHTHYETTRVSLHTHPDLEPALRSAMAAIGIAPSDAAAWQEIEPNIEVHLETAAEPVAKAA